MTILFLGGTGNISTECAALLHRRGHQIVILSRGKSPVPPEYRAVVADRKDPDSLRRAVAGLKVDVVANFIGYEVGDLETDYSVWRGAIGQYVFISSATVYAKPAGRPLVDTFITEVSQDTWINFPWDLQLSFAPPIGKGGG